ncbi:hypothetical protein D3C80_1321200 [compost metagenome]
MPHRLLLCSFGVSGFPKLLKLLLGAIELLPNICKPFTKLIEHLFTLANICRKLIKLALTAKQVTVLAMLASPGHRSAGINHIAFKRYNAEPILTAGSHFIGTLQIAGKHDISK